MLPESRKNANCRSQLHAEKKVSQICIHNPLGPSEKSAFGAKVQKSRYVRSLGKKTHFGAFPEATKKVLHVLRAALKKSSLSAAQRSQMHANPSGLSEKKVYCVESLRFCQIRWKFPIFRGVGWVPQKSADFGATAPA